MLLRGARKGKVKEKRRVEFEICNASKCLRIRIPMPLRRITCMGSYLIISLLHCPRKERQLLPLQSTIIHIELP